MGKLSAAVYGNSQLPVREREAARWTIALINDCAVCRDTRARDGEAAGAGEPFYAEVTDWRAATGLSTASGWRPSSPSASPSTTWPWTTSSGAACTTPSPRPSWRTSPSAAACSSAWAARWPWSGVRAPDERILV